MINGKPVPTRVLSKSKFSMYLRTLCDRELYLSLFKDQEQCKAAGIPIPLKSRPGVQLVTKSGREFEMEQYDQLINALPENVIHASRGTAPTDLIKALATAFDPCFILQPEIKPESFRETALSNIGLTIEEKGCIPPLAGLKPDVLFVHKSFLGEHEILSDGSRKAIDPNDSRLGISVIDLKNVAEGNPSYSAEVCMYAFFFANWLDTEGKAFKAKYYVSDQIYLWKHTEMPQFTAILGLKQGGETKNRIAALLEDLEDGLIDYLIYMPSVKKFFKEDVPRVVMQGDQNGWEKVEYHVNPRCGSCDWLGNVDWLIGEDVENFKKNPTHYCIQAADDSDHLSKLPNLSKGASQILIKGGLPRVADVAGLDVSSNVLKKHALLKKERLHITHRAKAIATGAHNFDNHNKIAGLARTFNAEYDIIVNFDAGADILTGVAVRGILFPPFGKTLGEKDGETQNFRVFSEEAFVVPKDTDNAEWVVLRSLISKLADYIQTGNQLFSDNDLGPVHTQICFWEERQYEELCNAFSRHLLKVLELPDRAQRALAWIFPADRLMEKDEEISPAIVFIKDIVDTTLRLPVKFATTLLGVSDSYHAENMSPRKIDRYYKEPLGNAVPRERIFEIWKSTTGTVKMYGQEASITDAIKKYEDVLKAHTWALASITRKLRTDLKTQLQGKAPALVLSELGGTSKVAYDSKLWIQWDRVNSATANTEDKAALIGSVERLESSYKAIVLTNMIEDYGGHRYLFEVSEESTEAKLEEGQGYYILGIVGIPGFPLLTPLGLGLAAQRPEDFARLRNPLYKIINVFLEAFDRVNRRAVIRIHPAWGGVTDTFNELFSEGLISVVSQPIYLLEGMSPDYSDRTESILKAVANPPNAKVSSEALLAMGKSNQKKLTSGTDNITPISRVLWEADLLTKRVVRDDLECAAIADFAEHANVNALNQSQKEAVRSCAKNQLSVIWGPPGTGKTDTLTALLHAFVHMALQKGAGLKILITGPNYRAVEELVGRLFENLNTDQSCDVDMFWCYSASRGARELPEKNDHFKLYSFTMSPSNAEWSLMRESINNPNRVSIVSTTCHIINRVVECASENGGIIQGLFDVVVIDESSQVEVARALQPLSVLRGEGQLIVAGDHLQMPPIAQLDPPKNAEYLVGSIQTYFIKRFKVVTQNLLVNYRSNQDLVDYAKTIGYPQNLQAYSPDKMLVMIEDVEQVIASLPESLPKSAVFKEVLVPERKVISLIHEDIVSSQANEVEAKLVAGLALVLRKSIAKELYTGAPGETFTSFTNEEFFSFGLGVVTPHKAQKALVIKELCSLFPETDPRIIYDSVDTVERFQGSQRQTILVSFGVGDTDIIEGEEEFLLQLERTNVAVSRAQAKCILLMPKSFAYHLPSDKDAAKTSRAIKSYIEEFCNNRFVCEIEADGEKRKAEVRWHS